MHRRRFLAQGAALFAGGFVCAVPALASANTKHRAPRRRIPAQLPPVRASWDRVLRTTVGLRPRRDSGFVLRADRVDATTIIHNYGHGGAGMSLGWGCAALVADLALEDLGRRAAVIGAGSAGLTTARELQCRGFDVTVYAMALPPDTTSNMSLASFSPASGLIAPNRRTPAWDAQYRRAVELSYRRLQGLVGSKHGVSWIDSFTATDQPAVTVATEEESALMESLTGGRSVDLLGPKDHPFPTRYAIRSQSMRIEPSIYLERLVNDIRDADGRFVIRRFDTIAELLALPEPLVVNCTGLGARELFGDEDLVPVKGQLTLLAPQPEVTYRLAARLEAPGEGMPASVSMTPRSDGIVLGNYQERGNWSLEPEDDVRRQVIEGAIEFFSAMH